MVRRLLLALACALLVTTAGCSGFLAGDASTTAAPTTESTTATTTTGPPTSPSETLAPGVTAGGVTDALALANAHRTHLRSHGFTKTARTTRTNASTEATRRTAVSYANESHWRLTRTGDGLPVGYQTTRGAFELYADGDRVLVRTDVAGNVSYSMPTISAEDRELPQPPKKVFPDGVSERTLVYLLFANANTTVSPGDAAAHVTGTADEMTLHGDTVTNVSFDATVTENGVVRSLSLSYTDGDATVERDISFRVDATVERPDWYDTARNRTSA
ncbi:hypothetical protein [Salarchaeum sp. JOR-1]|uniref:hypothetical protein n=1 Tax=Salarchaeum sp. JOR-1 TaxID=2599399 RepID=UPI00119848E5|nr:hypothetical protein [Salarchaeum sp. JOR-1]QDX40028.1 hypothetical protein FQU85_03625 [Salarchaeum sp. JOR-1]